MATKAKTQTERPLLSRDDFKELLGEGFHTAFRKGTEAPQSHQIWLLIGEMDNKDWGGVLEFVAYGFQGTGAFDG